VGYSKGFNRREFFRLSTSSIGLAMLDRQAFANSLQGTGDALSKKDWWDHTSRWIQLIMVDSDPGNYDLEWWTDFFKRTKSDGLCLSAGGLMAFYPTEIPFHYKSKFMKPGDDPFGDFVRRCRALNMTIVARTDSHSCLDDAAAAHPEWLNVDENGKPRRHWEMPETRWVTCAYGPYNFGFMTQVHKEIAAKYKIDGLFCNRWQGEARGMCYCESCKSLYHAYAGVDLPRGKDMTAPEWQKYNEWGQLRLVELWKLWDSTIRSINPDARYFSNTGLDSATEAKLTVTHLVEKQTRLDAPLWDIGRSAKEARAMMGKIPLIALTGIGSGERISVTSDAEQTMWLLDGIVQGMRPWVLKISAVVDDLRWTAHIEKLYPWCAENQKYLSNTDHLAKVGMLSNPRFRGLGAGRPGAGGRATGDAMNGFYQALVEGRIPFEFADQANLTAESLKPFSTLVLPNSTDLSDKDCDVIRQFVASGGNLVATFESSLYDENGKQRSDFGLADLFQVSYIRTATSGRNAYISIDQDTHPILRDLKGVTRITSSNNRVEVKSSIGPERAILTRIPPFPTIPMEEIYPRTPRTDIPEIYLRTVRGKGRVVYFPGDLDRTFSLTMLSEHGTLLRNMVDWASGEPRPVTIEGPGVVDFAYWKQDNSVTVHIANITNPMMLRGPMRELIPIGQQAVTIQLPKGAKPRRARLLVAGLTVPMKVEGQSVSVTIPKIVDHELVAIDL
jgi:Hypothetical glycosyl hydrolase 6